MLLTPNFTISCHRNTKYFTSVVYLVLFASGIHCYAATKVHYSFAAPQQQQPFLLRLWRVINPSTANATTTTRNLAMLRHGVVTGLKQGRAFKTRCSTQTWHTAPVTIQHTYSVRNISVRSLPRRRCGRRFYFWKDTNRTAAKYHTLLLKHIPHCHSIVLPKGWMNSKTGLCWREAKRITAKAYHCISRMSNIPTITLLTKKQR